MPQEQLLKPFEDVYLFKPKVFHDERGFFYESYKQSELEVSLTFPQDNHSFSTQNVLRGMHFQKGQSKWVRAIYGKIYDVVVDLREDSPNFGKWQGVILDDIDHHSLLIPDGFAHGFCVLSEEAHVYYKVSTEYDLDLESGFRFDDPVVGIEWPIAKPKLSDRDLNAKSFQDAILDYRS